MRCVVCLHVRQVIHTTPDIGGKLCYGCDRNCHKFLVAFYLILFHFLLRGEDVAKFIQFQEKEMEEFVAEREELIKVHGENMAAMKRRHWDEEVELEKEFNAELTQLMAKYSPHTTAKDAEVQST